MGTAVRVRRENTEHDTGTANGDHEGGDTSVATSEETRTALADNMPLMPPPPPPAADEVNGYTTGQGDVDDNAATETLNNAANKDSDDETVTIQKVALSDLI